MAEAQGIQLPVRACGECTMCCKLLGVMELKKRAGVWCPHCAIGSGCKIYIQRPPSCQDFMCLWLQGGLPEKMKPNKLRAVVSVTDDAEHLQVFIPVDQPDLYRRGPLASWTSNMLTQGVEIIVICGDRRKLLSARPETIRAWHEANLGGLALDNAKGWEADLIPESVIAYYRNSGRAGAIMAGRRMTPDALSVLTDNGQIEEWWRDAQEQWHLCEHSASENLSINPQGGG